MDIRLLLLYFVIGGLIVAVTAYYGTHGQGLLAAFVSLFPGLTIITFCVIYFNSGSAAVVSYAKGMLILLPPWILYLVGVYFLMPRLGLTLTLIISVIVFVLVSFLILKLR